MGEDAPHKVRYEGNGCAASAPHNVLEGIAIAGGSLRYRLPIEWLREQATIGDALWVGGDPRLGIHSPQAEDRPRTGVRFRARQEENATAICRKSGVLIVVTDGRDPERCEVLAVPTRDEKIVLE